MQRLPADGRALLYSLCHTGLMATGIPRVHDENTGRGEGDQADTERVAYIWHDMDVRGSIRGARGSAVGTPALWEQRVSGTTLCECVEWNGPPRRMDRIQRGYRRRRPLKSGGTDPNGTGTEGRYSKVHCEGCGLDAGAYGIRGAGLFEPLYICGGFLLDFS